MQLLAKHIIFSTLLCISSVVLAEKVTPTSDTQVIATWAVPEQQKTTATGIDPNNASAKNSADSNTEKTLNTATLKQSLSTAQDYLTQAARPGQSNLYRLTEQLIQPYIDAGFTHTELWFVHAQLLQHRHDFDGALSALKQVAAGSPNHTNVQLMRARIFLIQNKPDAAREACLALVGSSDLFTASVCALEVSGLHGDLPASYDQLRALVDRASMPADARGAWLRQILADMALRLDRIDDAVSWIGSVDETASVNYWAQWADIQLAADNSKIVYRRIQNVFNTNADQDDALLLRIAIAERQRGGSMWQRRFSERITLREQRRDVEHASEIARYYIDLKPNPEKALYWAELNWRATKEPNDKALLERAKAMTTATRSPAQPLIQKAST